MPVASASAVDVQAPRSAMARYRPSLRPTLTSTPEKAALRSVTTWPMKASTSLGAGGGVNRVMIRSLCVRMARPERPSSAPLEIVGKGKAVLIYSAKALRDRANDDGKTSRGQARRADHQSGQPRLRPPRLHALARGRRG